MRQIMVQGRGGQGAQTAGNLLAMALHAAGWHVQCFASYGGARRGTPVNSFLRADSRPIRLRCDIERADAILCFDVSLLGAGLLDAAAPGALVVVNSSRGAAALRGDADVRLLPIDGLAIAGRHGLGRVVNSALLGALVAALDMPTLEVMARTLFEQAPKLKEQNVAACRDGHAAALALLQEAQA